MLIRIAPRAGRQWLLALAAFAVALPTLASAQASNDPDSARDSAPPPWGEIEDNYRQRLSAPTPPVAVDRLILPWEPARAVVMVLPLNQWREQPGVHRIMRDVLAALLPHVTVIALYHELDHRLLADWLLMAENDPQLAPHLGRLELLPSATFSIWARDFSPIFARSNTGRLLAVDPSFLPTHRLLDLAHGAQAELDPNRQRAATRAALMELRGLRGADAVPALLASWLESTWHVPTALSRPPAYLLGGDFLPVDGHSALVSAITLAENGGRAEALRDTLRHYAGVERVVFLENLPGDTIEHLDFIVQPIAPEVILVAAPPPSFGSDRVYHRHLHAQLTARLQRNRAELARQFPDHRLIDVPTPPPLLDSETDVINELFLHCAQAAAARRGLNFQPPEGNADPLDPLQSDPRTAEALRSQLGIRNWHDPAARRKAVESFLQRPVDELVARHVEEHVGYRTYINSLYLRTAAGTELVLVPRYRAAVPEEAELLTRLESEVEQAYRTALPKATLQWIDCSELTGLLGAVHCLTATIPDPAALGLRTKAE